MMAKITRTYTFSRDDIRNALCEWLRKRDIPAPKYVSDTDCTTWETFGDGSQKVEWHEELEPRY